MRREEHSQGAQTYRFNSRTREGCDYSVAIAALFELVFQFTHPGGVRHCTTFHFVISRVFQFTHPGGVRRRYFVHLEICDDRFNSRTREGCDMGHSPYSAIRSPFQFTHPGGVRLFWAVRDWLNPKFQFTHPGGVRPHYGVDVPRGRGVSIHAPGRGATPRALMAL